jgi:hypothetical protein
MKTILIIDAFINDDADEARLINFIDSSRNIGDDILHKNITLNLEQDNIMAKIESIYWMGTTMDKISNNKTYTIIVNFDKNINRLRSKKLFIL